MNKQEVEQLIDRLADKTLSFGCEVKHPLDDEIYIYSGKDKGDTCLVRKSDYENGYSGVVGENILGHPIRIGDVLERIIKPAEVTTIVESLTGVIKYWQPLGFDKSLQQIVEGSGYNTCNPDNNNLCDTCGTQDSSHHSAQCTDNTVEHLKSPEARELLEFINNVL